MATWAVLWLARESDAIARLDAAILKRYLTAPLDDLQAKKQNKKNDTPALLSF